MSSQKSTDQSIPISSPKAIKTVSDGANARASLAARQLSLGPAPHPLSRCPCPHRLQPAQRALCPRARAQSLARHRHRQHLMPWPRFHLRYRWKSSRLHNRDSDRCRVSRLSCIARCWTSQGSDTGMRNEGLRICCNFISLLGVYH